MTAQNSLAPDQVGPLAWPDVEWVAIGELKANPKNARIHSQKQIGKIRQSIRTFGVTNPILVDENSVILAGHGRVEAARQEGLAQLPVLLWPPQRGTKARLRSS